MKKYITISEFQKKYKSREAKETELVQMRDDEITMLIRESPNIHYKIWLSRFLKRSK